MFKLSVLGLAVMSLLSGCASPMLTSTQMTTKVEDGMKSAIESHINSATPKGTIHVVETDPAADFKRVENAAPRGDVNISASSAAFGPIISELAKSSGYSVVFSDNVDALRKVSLNIRDAHPEQAIRSIGFLAGYAIVYNRQDKLIYVAESANYVFQLPAAVMNKLKSEYAFGGDSAGMGESGGGSSGGSSGGSGGSSALKAEFKVSGEITQRGTGLEGFLRSVGGPGVEVAVTPTGLISAKGSAQGLNRVYTFLKRFNEKASTLIDIKTSIVEVALANDFEAGIQWGRVMDSATKGAFINGSTGLATAITGNSTAALVNAAAGAASTASTNGLGAYRVSANSTSIIKALQSFTDTKVVATPSLRATNDTPAVFFDGTKVPFMAKYEQTPATVAGGSPTESATIGFAVEGISFSVVPSLMNNGNKVQITLAPVLSSVGQNVSFLNGKQTVPPQSSKSTLMTAIAQNGETVVVGSLRMGADRKNTEIAASTSRGANSKEVVILMTATIIPPSAEDVDPLFMESI